MLFLLTFFGSSGTARSSLMQYGPTIIMGRKRPFQPHLELNLAV